jgi:hypothetical protein
MGTVGSATDDTSTSGATSSAQDVDGSSGSQGSNDGNDDSGSGCVNLQCQQMDCPGAQTTTISGVVSIPSGDLPLPNVFVYVPNAEVEAVPEGVTCDRCDVTSAVPSIDDFLSGWPLVLTATNERGEFSLPNVPVGQNIPLVIQIGKWRRVTTVPNVTACTDNPVDPELTRLPRNQQEGSLPKIAITDGGCDDLHLLLIKAGVDEAEFTAPAGPGRVNMYQGEGGANTFNGVNLTSAQAWWSNLDNLLPYDIVLHSCECSEAMNGKPQAALEAMRDFVNLGGRVFGSHFHYAWMQHNPHDDWSSIAQWGNGGGGSPAHIDTTFDRGAMLADWMFEFGGSTVHGEVPISNIRYSVVSVNAGAQRWLSLNPDETSIQYMSFNAPLEDPPEERCGRFVFSDMHVTGGGGVNCSGLTEDFCAFFPGDCVWQNGMCVTAGGMPSDLSPQEMVLIYMLFDIASCIDVAG